MVTFIRHDTQRGHIYGVVRDGVALEYDYWKTGNFRYPDGRYVTPAGREARKHGKPLAKPGWAC